MNQTILHNKVRELLLANQHISNGYQYTMPSREKYPFQWLWDSCFHVFMYLRCSQAENAKKELLSLVSHQFKNGMIPHMIYWNRAKKDDFPVIHWGKPDTSTITQPPMLAHAAWAIYEAVGDRAFLQEIYPKLTAFFRFLLTDRDPRNVHLLGIIDPDESGEDNSPRFDAPLNLPPRQTQKENFAKRLKLVEDNRKCHFEGRCMRNFFWVRDVPFNVITIRNLRCLADIANVLDKKQDREYFDHQATAITAAMRQYMFEDGLFWPTWGIRPKRIKLKTWHIFAPLYAHLYTRDEAEAIVQKYLFKDGFDTSYGLPTVASDEASYDPSGFWRGPVWMASNWFIYKGLRLYGMDDMAAKIRQLSLDLIEQSGFREQFNPKNGDGEGARDFTWGGLTLDMDA